MYPMPKEPVSAVEFYSHCGKDERVFLIEECAELIQACTKHMRKPNETNLSNIAEEMAHVYLAMNHVREQYNINLESIQYYIDKKLEDRSIV